MTRTVTNQGQAELSTGVYLVSQLVEGTYHGGMPFSYTTHAIEGLDGATAVEDLATLAQILQNLPSEGALDLDEDDLEEYLKDYARDLAEDGEVPFTYTTGYGKTNTYTPASLWESSGGCEWETSAQEGYDYGWNI